MPCGFPPLWSQTRIKAKPVGTAKLATNKELVLHLVRQSGYGESSEDRSARLAGMYFVATFLFPYPADFDFGGASGYLVGEGSRSKPPQWK